MVLKPLQFSQVSSNDASLTSETNAATGGESTNYTYDSRNRLTQVQK